MDFSNLLTTPSLYFWMKLVLNLPCRGKNSHRIMKWLGLEGTLETIYFQHRDILYQTRFLQAPFSLGIPWNHSLVLWFFENGQSCSLEYQLVLDPGQTFPFFFLYRFSVAFSESLLSGFFLGNYKIYVEKEGKSLSYCKGQIFLKSLWEQFVRKPCGKQGAWA